MISISPIGFLVTYVDMIPILFTYTPWAMIVLIIMVLHAIHEYLSHKVDQLLLYSSEVIQNVHGTIITRILLVWVTPISSKQPMFVAPKWIILVTHFFSHKLWLLLFFQKFIFL